MYSILLAEDESLIRSNIIHQINNYMDGYSVMMSASAGDEAIRIMSNTEPDIILTDIRMPGADGLQVIRYAKERYGDIPCIVLTGFQDFDIVKEALQLGAIGYLLKPVQTGELIESLQRAAQMIKKKNMYDSLYPVVELEPYFIQAMNGDVSDVDAFVDKAKKCMPIMPDGDPKVVLAIDDYVMRNELIDLLNMKKGVVFSSRYLVYAVIIHIPKQWSQQRIQEEIRILSKQLKHPKPPAIGISRPFHGWEEALDRFEEAFQYYSYRFYIGSPWVAGPLEAKAASPHMRHAEAAAAARKAADRLELSNQLDRWHAIEEELQTWFGILRVEQWPVRVVHQECSRIIRKFLGTFTDDQLDLLGLKYWSATQWVVKKKDVERAAIRYDSFLAGY
ncbi:response regulator [Paenibacillus chungangensis]|uniref:Response regulator n=1 Tax=Paenibacillus chungangensis TaxID=696535 RepID=A0ABW3HP87_9BACL